MKTGKVGFLPRSTIIKRLKKVINSKMEDKKMPIIGMNKIKILRYPKKFHMKGHSTKKSIVEVSARISLFSNPVPMV